MACLKDDRPSNGGGNRPELITPNSKLYRHRVGKAGFGRERYETTAEFCRPTQEEGRGGEDGCEYGIANASGYVCMGSESIIMS